MQIVGLDVVRTGIRKSQLCLAFFKSITFSPNCFLFIVGWNFAYTSFCLHIVVLDLVEGGLEYFLRMAFLFIVFS